MELVLFSIVIVLSLLTTAMRLVSIRLLFGYALWVDLFFTFTITAAFMGTFSGVVAAALGGLILGVVLTAGRAVVGYDRLVLTGWRGIRPVFGIKRHPGLIHAKLNMLLTQIAILHRRMKAAGL